MSEIGGDGRMYITEYDFTMMRSRKSKALVGVLMATIVGVPLVGVYGRSYWVPLAKRFVFGSESINSVLEKYGPKARGRLMSHFEKSETAYPPGRVTLLASKSEAQLELWAASKHGGYRLVHRYPIQGLSGELGPKLREGDKQVPEGVYAIESLNPNSSYHLSMKLDYPNAFDRDRAQADRRTHPGTNIFIHGKTRSVGCLAMGDPAIEELFVLIADTGVEAVRVLIFPRHPRRSGWDELPSDAPPWTTELYANLEFELEDLPLVDVE